MSYASRYSQRTTQVPVAVERGGRNAVTPKRSVPTGVGGSGASPGASTARQGLPLSRGRGRWSATHVTRTTSGSPKPPLFYGTERLANAVTEKLRGFQELRELMEALAERHKKEEAELHSLMRKIIHSGQKDAPINGGGSSVVYTPAGTVLSAASPSEPLSSKAEEELRQAREERDKAIAMLTVFQREGTAVIHRMHASLQQAHDQYQDLQSKVEKQSVENARLRYIIREVRYDAVDADGIASEEDDQRGRDESDHSSDGEASPADRCASHKRLVFARCTISKLDELLQEADAVIVTLRGQNEELLRQNELMRRRERAEHGLRDDGMASDPASEHTSVDAHRDGEESLQAAVERLKAQLREEKQQRLEAEELSHKLLVEHQKNVQLLEQRLHHRVGVSTPRGSTPHKGPVRSSLALAGAPFEPTLSSTSTTSMRKIPSQTNLEEELELMQAAPDSVPLHPSGGHRRTSSAQRGRSLLADTDDLSHSGPAGNGNPTVTQRQQAEQLEELRSIEEQLNEVVASLEET